MTKSGVELHSDEVELLKSVEKSIIRTSTGGLNEGARL